MAVPRKAMTEGIRTTTFPGTLADAASQSLSLVLAGDARASSLYTREPGVLPHQRVVSDCSGTEKPRPEKSGRGGNMRDTGNQPLTEPAVTPLMMNLLRAMYTTTTGRMASRMNMYTLPMSNLE